MQLGLHMVTIEDLVPQGHLLRKLEAALDLGFVHEATAAYYSRRYGRLREVESTDLLTVRDSLQIFFAVLVIQKYDLPVDSPQHNMINAGFTFFRAALGIATPPMPIW